MNNILVTGGSGFIGGYVLRHLRQHGYNVINYDLVEGNEPSIYFIRGSILDPDQVEKAVDKVDIVFHFAGFSNINHVKAKPKACIELNIMGTANLLEALRCKHRGAFVFSSSVYVHNTMGHLYTTSKFSAERICGNYSHLYGLPVIILRIGTVYGERSRHEDVISIFVKKACRGEPIVIHGSGEQRRHFIHGEDIAEACRMMMERNIKDKTLILAGKQGISINKLASIISHQLPDIRISHEEKAQREDDYEGDISNVEETYRLLNWKPRIDVGEGVARLIRYFKAI